MKKELGKWFMDVAKYLCTVGMIAPWISDPGEWAPLIYFAIVIVFIASMTIGVEILLSEDRKEQNRNKNKK